MYLHIRGLCFFYFLLLHVYVQLQQVQVLVVLVVVLLLQHFICISYRYVPRNRCSNSAGYLGVSLTHHLGSWAVHPPVPQLVGNLCKYLSVYPIHLLNYPTTPPGLDSPSPTKQIASFLSPVSTFFSYSAELFTRYFTRISISSATRVSREASIVNPLISREMNQTHSPA